MALNYGFFNSVNGDRLYNADDISNFFVKLISNGVFATPASAMQVQASSGLTVQVSAGWAFINCRWLNNTAPYLITVDAADIVLNRIDRIVVRLDTENRLMTLAVKKGAPASVPVAPALTRANGIYELSLARVVVNAGVTTIPQSQIIDERANTSVCGYVTGLIDQIDTTDLFAQYDDAFNTWFERAKQDVRTLTMVTEFTSNYTTTDAEQSVIPINISVYNSTTDIINVYVNGIKLVQGVEYTADDDYITFTDPLDVVGTLVNIQVLKSINYEGTESIIQIVTDLVNNTVTHDQLEARINHLTFIKISQSDFDALTTKDLNTIYYVVDDNKITQYMGDIPLASGSGGLGVGTPAAVGVTSSTSGTGRIIDE